MSNRLGMNPIDVLNVLDWAEKNGTWAFYFGKMQHQWSGVEEELKMIRNCVNGRGRESKGAVDEERGQRFVDWWANNHTEPPQASGDVMVLCYLDYQKKAGKPAEPKRKGDTGSNWGGDR